MSYDEVMIELCMQQANTDKLLDEALRYVNAHGLEAFIKKLTKSYAKRQKYLKNAPAHKIWRRPQIIEYLESVGITPDMVLGKI